MWLLVQGHQVWTRNGEQMMSASRMAETNNSSGEKPAIEYMSLDRLCMQKLHELRTIYVSTLYHMMRGALESRH